MPTDREVAAIALEQRIRDLNSDTSSTTRYVIDDDLIDRALKVGAENVYLGSKIGYQYPEISFSIRGGFLDDQELGASGEASLVWDGLNGWHVKVEGEANWEPVAINFSEDGSSIKNLKIIDSKYVDLGGEYNFQTKDIKANGEIDAKVINITGALQIENGELVSGELGVSRDLIPGEEFFVEPGAKVAYHTDDNVVHVFSDANYYGEDNSYNYASEVFRDYIGPEIASNGVSGSEYFAARTEFIESITGAVEDGLPVSQAIYINVQQYVEDPTGLFPSDPTIEEVEQLLAGTYDPDIPRKPPVPDSFTEEELIGSITEAVEQPIIEGSITTSGTITYTIETSDGFVQEVFLNPAEQRIVDLDARIQDTESNGTIISEISGTASFYGVSFNTVERIIVNENGTQMRITDLALPVNGSSPSNGVSSQRIVEEYDWQGTLLNSRENTQFTDAGGRVHSTVEQREGADGNWHVQETISDINGNVLSSGPTFIVPSDALVSTLQQVGGTVGGMLANSLADGEVYKALAYKALLNTITDHFGTFTAFLATGNELQPAVEAALGAEIQGTALDTPEFAESFYKNLSSLASSHLSGLIIDEVGEALGIENTIVGEIFDVTAGAVTTGVIRGGLSLVFDGLDGTAYTQILNKGFDFSETITIQGEDILVGDYLQAQVINALAGYAGSRLAGEVIEPESEIAAVFGSAGSAFGAAVGAGSISVPSALANFITFGAPAGPIGVAIGAFVGTVVGTVFGNLFGSSDAPPSATAVTGYDEDLDEYVFGQSWANSRGDINVANSMVQTVIDGVNNVLNLSHGTIRTGSVAPSLRIGYEGSDFLVTIGGSETKVFSNSASAINYAAFRLMKDFDLVGGHAVVMRAWHNSEATNIHEWQEDLEVAEAFQQYLLNPTGILALMMDQPDSELAQSWATILQRAAELELHLPHEKDLDGGWDEILVAQGIDPESIPSIEGDTLVITDPVTGEETVLHHVIGPGYEIVRIEGTDGNDIIEVIVDGPSISYVEAGEGDDTVVGSDQADVIVGGTGDDTIDGLGGNDWIHGGDGEDNLDGGAGDDFVIGGNQNDILTGGADEDSVYGSDGDDVIANDRDSGQDFLFGGLGNDTIIVNGPDVSEYVYGGRDYAYGEDGDDVITAYGYAHMYGGKGNDILDSSDVHHQENFVIFGRDDGHDIVRVDTNLRTVIQFEQSIGINELFYQNVNGDLKISVLGEKQTVTVEDYFSNTALWIEINGLNGTYTLGGTDSRSAINQMVQLGSPYNPTGEYNYLSDSALQQIEQGYNFDDLWSNNNPGHIPGYIVHGTPYADDRLWLVAGGGWFAFGGAGNDNPITSDRNPTDAVHERMYGDSGNDVIKGGGGNDTLIGGLGNDNLQGIRHDDVIYGGYGNDSLAGQTGHDFLYGGHGDDSLYGGDDHDSLYGGDQNDSLYGGTGNDHVYGEAGDDTIFAEAGSDFYDGGEGFDLIDFGSALEAVTVDFENGSITGTGEDFVVNVEDFLGSDFNDIIFVKPNSTRNIDGRGGLDTVSYQFVLAAVIIDLLGDTVNVGWDHDLTNVENVIGSDFGDTIIGDAGINILEGRAGDDELTGGAGADTLIFNADFGNDTITDFELGVDEIDISTLSSIIQFSDLEVEQVGDDTLVTVGAEGSILIENVVSTNLTEDSFKFSAITGTEDTETINGTSEDDVMYGFGGQDYMYGFEGDDVIYGGIGGDRLYGNEGNDTLYGEEHDDKLYGHEGDDILYGDSGSDTLYGDSGEDILYGGTELDYLYGGDDNDTLHGGDGNDQLRGEEGNDIIFGDDGSDTIYGGNGDDVIIGGNGRDYLNGEAGADTFYLDLDEVDRVRDFEQSEGDKINISDLLDGYDSATDDVNNFVDIVIRSNTRTDIRVDEDGQGGNFQYVGIIYSDLTGETVDSLIASGALIAE